MRRVLMPRAEWATVDAIASCRASREREPRTLFEPAVVSDRTDGKIAHLDGLNLSRAWCWRRSPPDWSADDARRAIALEAADQHLAASLPHVAGDYAGEHWLATFALLALTAKQPER